MPNDATDLRFFVAVTEAGSLAEAARRMDVTPSAVSQHLRQLERRLGLHLVHRSTRSFSLTDEGELFYAGALDLLAQFDALAERLRTRSGQVAGKLNVCGPLGFGRHYLAPALADFHTLHPGLSVSLALSDEVPASDAQQFDLVVHIGHLPDSRMVAHPIAPNARFLCASPEYLARRPAPSGPQELAQHDCLVLRENQEDVTLWRLRRHRKEVSVRVPSALCSNDGEVVKCWALAGKGIMLRSEWDVADHLRDGRLVRVLTDWKLPDADVVALVDHRAGMSARVRMFLAFLQQRFQPKAPWR
jgi:DNA-binding transcriptional LysR family regulator